MASLSHTTTDHDEIKQWVEAHDGTPATVTGTEHGDEVGVLRIDFPGGAGSDRLEHIEWEDWFAKFDESDLAFLYQERKANGDDSTFFKLVKRGVVTVRHKPLAEQVIVVFGATSGVGRATAIKAVERGARVMATGRDEGALVTLQRDLGTDGALMTMVAEASREEQVQAVADGAAATFGRIDSWCHVAGIGEYASFEDITPEEFRRVVDVDLLGPVWGARAALPHLRRDALLGGAYVVVSSEIAKRSFPLATSYSAAKHGVDGFVEALRVELQHEAKVQDRPAISVTQVMPAAVNTPFFENARSHLGVRASGPPPVYDPDTVAEAVLRAAEHGGRDVAVGMAAKAQLAMQRVSPRLMDAFARATAFRLQRSEDPKQPGDGALFEAPDGDDRVHGVVTTTHR